MNFKFCPNCGTKDRVKQKNATEYYCSICGWLFWNNPKACVAVAFIKNGKVLVAKRGIEPNKGRYDLPGGFMEYQEKPEDCVRREIKEETGVTVLRMTLVAAFMHEYMPGISSCDLIFVAHEWRGKFQAADDVAQLEWQPFSFIESDVFVPPYTGLPTVLEKYATIGDDARLP